jgi:hypothetical protein
MKTEIAQRTENNERKKKRKKVILICMVSFLLVLLLILLYVNNMNLESTGNPTTTTSYLSGDGNAIDGIAGTKSSEEILDSLRKQELVVTDTLSSNIIFSTGQAGTVGSWVVENPSTNNVIQQAEIYYNGQLIAKSVPIFPNQHIESIELNQDIPTGEYEAIAYINYYKLDTQEYVSKTGYKIHLTVH